jgi:hypothetical protein
MKAIRNFIISLPDNEFLWFLLKPFAKLGYVWWTAKERSIQNKDFIEEYERQQALFKPLFKDLTVMHGPFKGVKYPEMSSFGSSLFAKLIGSYEREIHSAVEEFCNVRYTEIVNIGCGEGYYSVGLAKKIPTARIFAYDIDPEARELSRRMAEYNEVADRIEIRSEITPEELHAFAFTEKGLIFCDCEGYERTLFNQSNISNLASCDLIIETHDFIDIEISSYLKELFKMTHSISFVRSIDDIDKVKDYHYPELSSYSLKEKKILLHEGRPAIMEWMICRSKL